MYKKGYVLYERTGSNHKYLIGLFETEHQAKLYVKMLKDKGTNKDLIVEVLNFLDDDPCLVESVLDKK